MDPTDGVVDIEERHTFHVGDTVGQTRHPWDQPDQQAAGDLVELVNVAASEGSQKLAQCRSSPGSRQARVAPGGAEPLGGVL
ncbi:hypothetical protein [Nocardioides sp.]|uniref:hypothetical protein n=1 Tax=Nocardioides sp. TaxID=35761 RepID=UPI0039E6E3C4